MGQLISTLILYSLIIIHQHRKAIEIGHTITQNNGYAVVAIESFCVRRDQALTPSILQNVLCT